MAKNNKTRLSYVLCSDKTWVFDQSERAQGPISIMKELPMYWTVTTFLSRFYLFLLKCYFLFHQIIIISIIVIIIYKKILRRKKGIVHVNAKRQSLKKENIKLEKLNQFAELIVNNIRQDNNFLWCLAVLNKHCS